VRLLALIVLTSQKEDQFDNNLKPYLSAKLDISSSKKEVNSIRIFRNVKKDLIGH